MVLASCQTHATTTLVHVVPLTGTATAHAQRSKHNSLVGPYTSLQCTGYVESHIIHMNHDNDSIRPRHRQEKKLMKGEEAQERTLTMIKPTIQGAMFSAVYPSSQPCAPVAAVLTMSLQP